MPELRLHDKDPLDRMIDAALASYADPGSESGLETRVLARIEGERRRRTLRGWFLWAGGLALAASLLLLFFSKVQVRRAPATIGDAPHPLTATESPAPKISVNPLPTPRPRRASAPIQQHKRETLPQPPKLPVFPSPAPLSAEEEALVHLATRTTSDERKAILAAQQDTVRPLHIASISISPIDPPAEGKE